MSRDLTDLLIRALNEFSISEKQGINQLRGSAQENLAEVVQSLVREDDIAVKKLSSIFLKSEQLALSLSIYLQAEHAGTVRKTKTKRNEKKKI